MQLRISNCYKLCKTFFLPNISIRPKNSISGRLCILLFIIINCVSFNLQFQAIIAAMKGLYSSTENNPYK